MRIFFWLFFLTTVSSFAAEIPDVYKNKIQLFENKIKEIGLNLKSVDAIYYYHEIPADAKYFAETLSQKNPITNIKNKQNELIVEMFIEIPDSPIEIVIVMPIPNTIKHTVGFFMGGYVK